MQIFIGEQHYFASPAAITLLRYRALFGASFVSEFLSSGTDPRPALTRLVYASLEDVRRPCWEDYIHTVRSQTDFYNDAVALLHETMKSPNASGLLERTNSAAANSEIADFDEAKILSLCMECGAPEWLFLRFPIFFIVDILVRVAAARNQGLKEAGRKRYTPMTASQIRNLYL